MSAVVVDLPLVPVMPTTLCGGSSGRARANSSMSPMISTPASRARCAIGWRLRGRPGVTTRLSNWVRSAVSRSAMIKSSLGKPGEGDHAEAMVEGAQGSGTSAPSTALRAVPLPVARARGSDPRLFLRIPRRDLRAAGEQRLDRRQARPREAVDRVMLAGEGPGGDHLSFRVARPASASTKLMIQKRITTVGSDQPRCSKWWWIGAIRNTRLPVRL